MKAVQKISDFVFRIEQAIAMLFGAVILLTLSLGVLYRYILEKPLIWSDELALFSLAWITFIGGSMGIKKKVSPSVSMLTDALHGKTKKIVELISLGLLLAFIGFMLWISIGWLTSPNIAVQQLSTLKWPKVYAYLCIPISFTFMFIHVLSQWIQVAMYEAEVK
ncbi:TRAP transporter small permease [Savagea sp. SN6]|uniref:TRAP transporter small permease n=1 Tax=Savagea serpentis TaxID=2785297 RepID=A0A8J7G6U1_9BACL|nr:TRAP transporter small permease [Savagea serpentis]MBF4501376.1 TRAP transporter small permease [Savagea serpentis]